MKRVYQSSDYYSAQLVKAYLEDNAIEATVTGEMLLGAIGELPANSYPAVWVTDDEDEDRAKALIAAYEQALTSPQANSDMNWICPGCGESIERQFAQCWNCGSSRSKTD